MGSKSRRGWLFWWQAAQVWAACGQALLLHHVFDVLLVAEVHARRFRGGGAQHGELGMAAQAAEVALRALAVRHRADRRAPGPCARRGRCAQARSGAAAALRGSPLPKSTCALGGEAGPAEAGRGSAGSARWRRPAPVVWHCSQLDVDAARGRRSRCPERASRATPTRCPPKQDARPPRPPRSRRGRGTASACAAAGSARSGSAFPRWASSASVEEPGQDVDDEQRHEQGRRRARARRASAAGCPAGCSARRGPSSPCGWS